MNHSKNILMRLVYFILLYFIYWNIFNYLKLDLVDFLCQICYFFVKGEWYYAVIC